MSSEDYKRLFREAQADLIRALQDRDRLNLEIVRLQRLASSLAGMANQSERYEQTQQAIAAEISFIETVHAIIRSAERPLTAIDVRERLAHYGYDLSVYSNPMGFVHTSLKRLKDSGRIAEAGAGAFAPGHAWESLLKFRPHK
jgi:hypothetical protein